MALRIVTPYGLLVPYGRCVHRLVLDSRGLAPILADRPGFGRPLHWSLNRRSPR